MNIKLRILRILNKIMLSNQTEIIYSERWVKNPLEYYIEVKEQ